MSTSTISVPSANKAGACPAVMCGDLQACTSGVIVLQEWWGVNEQIQDCAKHVCQGTKSVTVVPDLYRGKMATDNEEAGHLMGGLDWKGAIDDIQGCARYLRAQGCAKVGVTGFCMGGALALAAAALVEEVDAAAPFYGIPSSQLCDVTDIKVPLQCHFAEHDATKGFASPDEWKPLQTKLQVSLKDKLEFHTYSAGHAFTNTTSDNYDEAAAQVAFTRMFAFFKTQLS